MRRLALLAGLAFAAACGGSSAPGPVAPEASPDVAVTRFLRAVADSNLTAMGQLWGTADGPAAVTRKPGQWQKRLEVIQYYLRHDAARISSSGAVANQSNRHAVTVELARQGCLASVPFVLVRTNRYGWLVTEIDLDAVGNPARRCDQPGTTGG